MRKQQQTRPLRFLLRVAKAFVPELTEATFGRSAHVQKTERCRFGLRSVLHVRERHKAKKKSFSEVSAREHCIREAASQIDRQNQGTICKNVLCSRESMAKSIDCTHAKPSLVKRRRFQTFKKASHEKWPCITIDEESDT